MGTYKHPDAIMFNIHFLLALKGNENQNKGGDILPTSKNYGIPWLFIQPKLRKQLKLQNQLCWSKTKGIHDIKKHYPPPQKIVITAHPNQKVGCPKYSAPRNCVHIVYLAIGQVFFTLTFISSLFSLFSLLLHPSLLCCFHSLS